MTHYIDLNTVHAGQYTPTSEELDDIKSIFLKGMRSPRNKYTVNQYFDDIPSRPREWFFGRIMKYNEERWGYCAGQSYPCEITQIRNHILKGDW